MNIALNHREITAQHKLNGIFRSEVFEVESLKYAACELEDMKPYFLGSRRERSSGKKDSSRPGPNTEITCAGREDCRRSGRRVVKRARE